MSSVQKNDKIDIFENKPICNPILKTSAIIFILTIYIRAVIFIDIFVITLALML